MGQPVRLVGRVTPPHEDVLHDVVEAALLAPKNVQGILSENLQAEAVETEMRPGNLDHLGIEFHTHDFGVRRQVAKDPGDAPPAQAQDEHPAPAAGGQCEHGSRQRVPDAARSWGVGPVPRREGLVDDQPLAEAVALHPDAPRSGSTRRTHALPFADPHAGILAPMTEPLFASRSRRAVRVALPVPIDSLFTYRVPDPEGAGILPGQRALVPFAGRKLTGVIVECLDLDEQGDLQHTGIAGASPARRPEEEKPTQEIERILDTQPVLSSMLLALLIDAARETLCPPGIALATALPAGSSPRIVKELRVTPRGRAALGSGGARGSAAQVLQFLEERPLARRVLMRRLPEAKDVLEALLADGLVREIQAMRSPSVRVTREKVARVVADLDVERALDEHLGRAPQQAQLLRTLADRGPTPARELTTLSGTQPAQLRALVSRGLAETFERDAPRNVLGPPVAREDPLPLTDDQARVLEPIAHCVAQRRSENFLLHGVTGSGKTEIYLRAVAGALAEGRQALVLVPEISLTHQIVARLRARFGDDLAVLHSGLQPSERLEQWERLRAGKTPIAVGARSALFAPLGDVGVIVVDEEHDPAYKNEQGFRYHAGRLAERLGELCKCPVILGSATPALESRFRADRGELQRLVLARRIGGRPLPAVEIVDLEAERRRTPRGRKLILSKPLRRALEQTLAGGAQTILFLNRRGFSTRIFCFDCGFAEHCPECDVALVYHASEHALRCHYCEFIKPPPGRCGGCGNTDTALLGTGTERLEEEVRAFLPTARTARLDRDSAGRRGHLRAVLDGLAAGEIDILIGTQMIAKGHDFPGVQLVGVVAADLGLHMPDFRAAERCFQLLTQVAGRAGRAEVPGRVILQSFLPDHYAIRPVLGHDYETFYREEIGHRSALGYPPFGSISQVMVSAPELEKAQLAAEALAAAGRSVIGQPPGGTHVLGDPLCEVLGPVPAAFPRLRGRHRQQIIVKGSDTERIRAVSAHLAELGRRSDPGIQVAVDVNPMDML